MLASRLATALSARRATDWSAPTWWVISRSLESCCSWVNGSGGEASAGARCALLLLMSVEGRDEEVGSEEGRVGKRERKSRVAARSFLGGKRQRERERETVRSDQAKEHRRIERRRRREGESNSLDEHVGRLSVFRASSFHRRRLIPLLDRVSSLLRARNDHLERVRVGRRQTASPSRPLR